jgi:hypothetical protein
MFNYNNTAVNEEESHLWAHVAAGGVRTVAAVADKKAHHDSKKPHHKSAAARLHHLRKTEDSTAVLQASLLTHVHARYDEVAVPRVVAACRSYYRVYVMLLSLLMHVRLRACTHILQPLCT